MMTTEAFVQKLPLIRQLLAIMTLALLVGFVRQLSKRAQNNTVVVQQEIMDRVGFEPPTSAAGF
jgi:hypothetical protein